MYSKTLFLLVFLCGTVQLFGQQDTLQYLFLGHTYEWWSETQKIDFRLEAIDRSDYDQIWLGGDICSESAQDYSTLEYLDRLFNLADPKNHWALGNHDHRNGNMEWIEAFTKRNDFYSSFQDGITVINWNTNLNTSNCEDLNKQFEMVMTVCDTISESSHLVLLYHHNIWSNIEGITAASLGSHGVLEYYNTSCDSTNALFHNTVYPKLVEVQNRGIQVINIMGDAGTGDPKAKQSSEGIWFIASGINATYYKDDPEQFKNSSDEILLIKHIPAERKLWWEYLSLDELYENR